MPGNWRSRRRFRGLWVLIGVAGLTVLVATAGCNSDAQKDTDSKHGSADLDSATGTDAADTVAPLLSKPPQWYVSTTDRFQRLFAVAGRATVSPGGTKLLVMLPGPRAGTAAPSAGAATPTGAPVADTAPLNGSAQSYRILDITTGRTMLDVPAATLRGLLGVAADAVIETRTNEAGWLLFRALKPVGAAGTGTNAGAAAVAGSGTREQVGTWQRYYPSTQHAKPLFDGMRVYKLSRNLNYGIGVQTTAPEQILRLDLTAVDGGGLLHIDPLPAALVPSADSVQRVGDTGVLELQDGSFLLTDGTAIPAAAGTAPWDGGFLRCVRDEDGLNAATLTEPASLALLPANSKTSWFLTDRVLAFDGTTLWAISPQWAGDYRRLPLTLAGAAVPDSSKPAADPQAPQDYPGRREILSMAVLSQDVIVLAETGADGQPISAVYRWTQAR